MLKDKILIGKITSTHGVKGQVKIMSFCHNPIDIGNYKPILDDKDNEFELKITSKAQGKNNDIFIATINGVNNKNEAEDLRNTELFINKDQLEEGDEGEFYYADLIGLDVVDNKNNKIGKVIDVVDYGAGEIIEIEFKDKTEMFSFRDDIFPEINVEEGFIKFITPETVEVK